MLGELGEDLAGSPVALRDHRQQQRFLGTEVVQDAGRGEIDLLRDLRQRAAAIAALGEDLEGGVDDRLAALRALLRLALQLLHAQSLTTDGILNKRSGYSGGRDWQGGPVQTTEGLTLEQRAHYDEIGFIVLRGFAERDVCDRMLERVVEIARLQASGAHDVPGLLLPEANLRGRAGEPEELVSKIFKLHRDSVFAEFAASRDVTDLLVDLIGPSLDCFLSQFIFKNPGAWGQPWHQDGFYFPFEPRRPIVGVWLAVSEATLENGCLRVLPGSHHEAIHEHVADRRPERELRLRRDRRPRHGRRDPGAHGTGRPVAVRQSPHAPLDRQRVDRACAPRWCSTTRRRGRSTATSRR